MALQSSSSACKTERQTLPCRRSFTLWKDWIEPVTWDTLGLCRHLTENRNKWGSALLKWESSQSPVFSRHYTTHFLPARSEGHPWESWLARRLSHFWKREVLQWDGQVSHSEGHQLAIPVHICTVVPANLLVPHLYFFNVSPNIFSPHTSYVNVSGQPQFNRYEKKGSKMK